MNVSRKEKRDLVLSMCLGDGCLAYTSNRRSATLTIAHCLQQEDFLQFKCDMLSKILDRDVVVRKNSTRNIKQASVAFKRFKAWRKFTYPNNKKDIAKILPFINNKYRALAFWLMDDGYVESSKTNGVNYGARFRIFTCDQTMQTHEKIKDWFYKEFDAEIKIKHAYNSKRKKTYPFIKFSQNDTLNIWKYIRDFVLQIPSMQYKFRYVEEIYQKKLSQRTTD